MMKSRVFLQFLIVSAVFVIVILGSMPTIQKAQLDEKANSYSRRIALEEALVDKNYQTASADPKNLDRYLPAADAKALTLIRQTKYDEAAAIYQQELVATWGAVDNAYNEKWVAANNKSATILRDRGSFDSALICYQAVLDQDKKYLQPSDPRFARELNNIGLMHYMIGLSKAETKDRKPEFALAVDNYKKALDVVEKSDKKTVHLATLWNLYLAERDLGDKAAAADYQKQAQDLDNTMHRVCAAP
jgi:hypothetical protein